MVLGHEFMGVVEETGPEITELQRGERVVVPFPLLVATASFVSTPCPDIAKTLIRRNTDLRAE
jgi:S-(hydroxymethyl)glutathione dehydrogenase / alcohol dehydrogenase